MNIYVEILHSKDLKKFVIHAGARIVVFKQSIQRKR